MIVLPFLVSSSSAIDHDGFVSEFPFFFEHLYSSPLVAYDDPLPILKKELPPQKGCSRIDLLFLYDLTASMEPYLLQARVSGQKVLSKVHEKYADSRFALAGVQDFPFFTGTQSDRPYTLFSSFPSSHKMTFKAFEHMRLGNGGDDPEAYPYALRSVSNEDWREDARRFVLLVADSTARHTKQLQESVFQSNFELLVLAEAGVVSYWENYASLVFPFSPQENLEEVVLGALEKACTQEKNSKALAWLL